jgi:cyclopropane-fatty-acyl-phospholipid synthase
MKATATSDSLAAGNLSLMDRLARRVVISRLAELRRGEMTLCDSTGSCRLGRIGTAAEDSIDELHATLRVNRPRFFRDAIVGGAMSVAESYLRGDWDCDDLTSLFRIFIRNREAAYRVDSGVARLAGWAHRAIHWLRGNSRRGSRQNIHAHYDLGNDFFRLWLDETMAYSSGIFPHPAATLLEASREKFDRVCRKLDLQPRDHVLEIGSGWGGFAIHAAGEYGCRVTTTTISQAQRLVALERIRNAGHSQRVEVLDRDYRDLEGKYDKLVSIEMIEAVGHKYLDAFFRKCGDLLRPDGSLVLQAIVMPDRYYEEYLSTIDFMRKYIFPGGCLPSLGTMIASAARTTDLRFVHAEDFAPHYAETLRRWRSKFHERLDDVRALGYPNEFLRMWDYYLCQCEAVFEERHVGVVQIQFDKPLCRCDPLEIGNRAASGQRRATTDFKPHVSLGRPNAITEGAAR